ncbi:VUT family protein [Methanothrix sp.]|uniref:VUT family protein n=1 Tax=Methanothrix sp. TaxID=90426 RepID=UPI003D120EF3
MSHERQPGSDPVEGRDVEDRCSSCDTARRSSGFRIRIDKTQAAIILCGLYIFFSLAGNIAATKVTYFGRLVMDAGFIYSMTFTWRDLIHKQLGKRAAITTIWLSAFINLLAALYFQIVVLMPAEPDWAANGGQAAWQFLFGIFETSSGPWWQSIFSLQLRIVLGSVITMVIAELIDTQIYHLWVTGWGRNRPQWARVAVSNAISIPVDSTLFPLIAFTGIIGFDAMVQMFQTNIVVKAIVTILSFWTIYLVPERPIFEQHEDGAKQN